MNLLQYCFCFYVLVFWLPGMWDLSFPARDGSYPYSPAVEGEVLTTGLPRSSPFILSHRHSYHFFPPPTPGTKLRQVPSPLGMLATSSSLDGSISLLFSECPELTDTSRLTFLDVRGLAAFDFFPPFFPDVAFLPLFSGGGERIVSDLPLVPRFLASSSGWILGRTPPLAMVTPFSS